MAKLKDRKTTGLRGADYSHAGAYFLTICTQNRACILSRIVPSSAPPPSAPHVGTGVPDGPFCGIVPILTHYGKIADKYINQMNEFYSNISIKGYVIMPKHIHILLCVKGDDSEPSGTSDKGPSGTPVPTEVGGVNAVPNAAIRDGGTAQNTIVARFLSTFKRFCNKEYGRNIWQSRSFDHIIRNRRDYDEHLKYIHNNPAHWYYDELYTEESKF